MLRARARRPYICSGLTCLLLALGCRQDALDRHYVGEAGQGYYRGHVNQVAYPNVCSTTPEVVQCSLEPHTVREECDFEMRPIALNEAVMTALQNAQIIRSNAQFLSGGSTLLDNPNFVTSVYDPAIQESGVLFGNRGVEAALADFDANFSTSMLWGRNETIPNFAPGRVVSAETAAFESALTKQFATGGTIGLSHTVNYLGTTQPGVMLPSTYTGALAAEFRQPLLAGSGVEYTRVAGPSRANFGAITGVSQGVVIARINNDLTIAQFEGALHDLVTDVENAYWDLYLTYRNFDTASHARDAAMEIYRKEGAKRDLDESTKQDFAQIESQLFATRAAVVNTRSQLLTSETRLRRLLGMPVNDGMLLQPSDEPVSAQVIPEWYCNLTEALGNRVELRAQKWNIKSLELQLGAAQSLTRPRLDAVAGWQVNGFGDQLFPHSDPYPGSPPGLRSMYERMAAGSEQGWNAGVQLNVPIGFRQAHAQVRNYELRLAKARKVLSEQEKEIAQELAVAFQEVARTYEAAVENYNRFNSAVTDYNYRQLTEGQVGGIDDTLRAQQRRAEAEVAYFTSLIDYNKSLNNLQYRKGAALAHNNVHLREGPWTGEAHADAQRRHDQRAHSFDAPWKTAEPQPFASSTPVGVVNFQTNSAAAELGGWSEGEPPQDAPPASPPATQSPPTSTEPLPPAAPTAEGKVTLSQIGHQTTTSGGGNVRSPLGGGGPPSLAEQGVEPVGWWHRLR